MGTDYGKDMYRQLMDVMGKLEAIEDQHQKDRTEIRQLTAETKSLRKGNEKLRAETALLKTEVSTLREKNTFLEIENQLLRVDNERMKRILNNDSSNSSCPPSSGQHGKAPNTYNGRKEARKKPGAQPDHKGRCLSKMDVEDKIRKGIFGHRTEEIGIPG